MGFLSSTLIQQRCLIAALVAGWWFCVCFSVEAGGEIESAYPPGVYSLIEERALHTLTDIQSKSCVMT